MIKITIIIIVFLLNLSVNLSRDYNKENKSLIKIGGNNDIFGELKSYQKQCKFMLIVGFEKKSNNRDIHGIIIYQNF